MRYAPLDRPWTWLLVLRNVAGVRERLSGRPVDVVEPDGKTRLYRGGLPLIEIGWSVPVFDAAVGDKTLTLDRLPLNADAARGYSYVNHEAELSAWIEGTSFEERILCFTGRVTAQVVGQQGEGVTLELSEAPFVDQGRLLGEQAVIREDDWTSVVDTVVDNLDGKALPMVFGTPGVYGRSKRAPGSPAIVIGSRVSGGTTYVRLAIAEGPVIATEVTIYSPDAPSATNTVVKAVTRVVVRGRKRSVVDIELGVDLDDSPDIEADTLLGWSYYVIWDQGGGGLRGPDQQTMHQAGACLEWALRRSTLTVDYSRLAVAAKRLVGYRVDTYVDDPDMTPFEWVMGALMPFLPISLVSGPLGIYPLVWNLDQEKNQAVARLTEGLNCWRLSQPETWDVTHAGRIEVKLGQNDETGDALKILVHQGRVPVPVGESCSSTAIEAAERWGHDRTLSIDATASWETATGWLAALARGDAAGPDWQVIEYRVDPKFAGLEHGDMVLLTSEALRIAEGRAYVIEPTWTTVTVKITLIVCFTGTLR